MKRTTKKVLGILISLILVFSVVGGVILTTRILYKVNYKTEEEIIAEKNEIVLGEESILYVDLTKKPEDYQKISKVEKKNEENNEVKKEDIQENNISQDVDSNINQQYFDMEFNVDSGTAIVDGSEIKIGDLLNISKEDEQVLSSSDDLYDYLNDNIVGDVEYENGKIKVENPYSTNTIMMKTSNLSEIENCGEVKSIVKIVDDIYSVHYENAKATKEGYNILKDNDLVEKVCKDVKITALDDVSENVEDTKVEALEVSNNNYAWGISSTGLINYANKINYGNNNTEIKVGVFDTGVRVTHEVFASRATSDRIDTTDSYNYISDNNNIADDNGHGTMVAGIIAESTSNNVKIVPVKVLDNKGNGDYVTALEGLAAVASKVDVINLSLGIDEANLTSEARTFGEQILKQIYDSGKMIVCATGNGGEDRIGDESVYYPASSKYTVAVSAIDSESNIASFSNYGSTVDFVAPGKSLILPYYTGDNLYNSSFEPGSEEYGKNSGTSFATPFIAAATSMIKSENYSYNVEQVKQVLKDNSEDLGDVGKDKYYGYGSINFDSNMFSKPVIASVNVSSEWSDKNTIEIYAVCGNPIVNWFGTALENAPQESDWRDFSSSSRIVKLTLTAASNGDYYIWLRDENGNTTKQMATVQYVDNKKPTVTKQISVSENSSTGFKAKVSAQDSESGLQKINWYYKKVSDADYKMLTDTYTTTNTGETDNTEKVHQFSNLANNTTYSVYAEIYDIVGNFVKTNVITTNTLETSENVNTGNTNTDNTNTGNTNTDNTNTGNTNTDNTNTGNTNTDNTNTGNTNTGNTNTGNENSNGNNKGNTNQGGTNTGKNTSLNSININSKGDNSTSGKILPYTGNNKIIILSFIVILISGIFAFVKYKKLKEIK